MNCSPVVRFLFSKCARVEAAQKVFQSFKNTNLFSTTVVGCDITSDGSSDYPSNSSIVPNLVNNRNPRNLEKLRIGDKPSGYTLERESRSYWNKVTLEISSRHVTASVVHHLGQKPINVSTKEWCLQRFLYSTNDASAAKLVGQVLAQRCLQMGIFELACFFPEEDRKKEKVKLFLSAVEAGGITLAEPKQIPPDWNIHHHEPAETPWEVHEDVDDKFTISAKLGVRVIREEKSPNAKTQIQSIRNKYAAIGTKTDLSVNVKSGALK